VRRQWLWLAVVIALTPAVALGAEGARTVLDFGQAGPLREYFGLAKAVARSYLPFSFILAVVLEAVGHAPGVPRNYAEVFWRFLVIVFLLANYQRIFGYVITVADEVADRLCPPDALGQYHQYLDEVYEENDAANAKNPPKLDQLGDDFYQQGVTGEGQPSTDRPTKWSASSMFYDGLMGLLLALAKAIVYGLDRLSRILGAVFFILGPLALVAGIPRQSGTASKWFRHFVTIACWPIFSGVLLGVMTAVAKQSVANRGGSYTGNLVSAVVMALCALAAPIMSGWIIGGAAQNVAGLGHASLQNLGRNVSQAARQVGGAVRKFQKKDDEGGSGGGGEGGKRGKGGSAGGSPSRGLRRGAVQPNPPRS